MKEGKLPFKEKVAWNVDGLQYDWRRHHAVS